MNFLNRSADYIACILVAAVAVGALVVSNEFPSTPIPTDIGAGAFPRAFACLLLFLCVCLALERFFYGYSPTGEGRTESTTTARGLVRPVIGAVAMIVYIALLSTVGYLITTVCFLFAMIRLMGFRSLLWNIVISIALTAILYFLFKVGLQVPLPEGTLFESFVEGNLPE